MGTTFGNKSSFTAYGVAFRRSFTDIPFSREIFDIMSEISPISENQAEENKRNTGMIPFFEARYLMTDRELKKSGITQVLELASGLSPRGFIMTEDPNVTYVEVDLPENMELKKRVLRCLFSRRGTLPNENLFLEEADVLNPSQLMRARSHFNNGPVAIIAEGLLRYISLHDKMILMKHISAILHKHGGVFITSDTETMEDINSKPESVERYERMKERTGIDVRLNLFQSKTHMKSFSENFRLQVREFFLLEVADELTSPSRVGLSGKAVAELLKGRSTFVMTPK